MTTKHKRILGDTLTKLNLLIVLNGDQYDLTGKTVKWELEEDDGTSITSATATGVTIHPTQAFTVDTTTNHLKAVAHGVNDGQKIVVATSATLPSPLVVSTNYFAIQPSPDRFKVEEYPGGGPIDITTSGSGSHTFYLPGSVQYDFQAGEVDAVGLFRAWLTVLDGGLEVATFPDDDLGIPIEILPKGN